MPVTWSTVAKGVRCYDHAERRLKSGRYDRYFAIRYTCQGQRHEEALGWASEGWTADKAQSILARIKEGIRTGKGPFSLADMRQENMAVATAERRAADAITLGQFFDDYYLPAAKKRKRTWSHDAGRFDKSIRPLLGEYPVRGITGEHMENLLAHVRKSGASEATALQYMAVMRQVFTLARVTLIDGEPLYSATLSPLDTVRLPKARIERERFLTYEEADALIEACRALSPDLADMAALSLNTGLRFGELLRLEWSDISLTNAVLTVRDEDMRKPGGKVPLNRAALDILKSRHTQRKKGAVHIFSPDVTGKDGYPMRRQFGAAVDACALNQHSTSPRDRVVFHTLRHTFASWLAISGHADIYRIKTLMRHKTIKMTERYAHLLPDATRDAVNHLRPLEG